MAIARVSGQNAKGLTDGGSSVSVAYPGNVTAGNLLVIAAVRGSSQAQGSDPIAVGDISKSAGTATLGTFTLDVGLEDAIGGDGYSNVAIFSVPVTATGSCTIQVAGGPTSSYWVLVVQEYSGADVSGTRVADTSSASDVTPDTTPLSGNADSGGAGVFVGAFTSYQSAACTIAPQAAFSTVQEEEDGSLHQIGAMEDQIVASSTTDQAEWTLGTSGSWVATVAVYKEAAATRKWIFGR